MRLPFLTTFVTSFLPTRLASPSSFLSARLAPPSLSTALSCLTRPTMGKKSGPKFYAVRVGRNGFQGVLPTWAACQPLVIGVPGSIFKSFPTHAQAVAFSTGGASPAAPFSTSGAHVPVSGGVAKAAAAAPRKKRAPPGNRDTHGRRPAAVAAVAAHAGEKLTSHTDGACRANGTARAKAGVGAYFGEGDRGNVSEPLDGAVQTNQRAEMTGVLRAMEVAEGRLGQGGMLTVISDSKYSVHGLNWWYEDWRWEDGVLLNKVGRPVLNADLWEAMTAARARLEEVGVLVNVTWVKGHNGDVGNEAADQLAVRGIDEVPRGMRMSEQRDEGEEKISF